MRKLIFPITLLFLFLLGFFMKGYIINLIQKRVLLSEEFLCKYHCAQTLISSLLIILIAFFIIGWSQLFIDWIQKMVPGINQRIIPSAIVLKIFGIVMLIIVTISVEFTCKCIFE